MHFIPLVQQVDKHSCAAACISMLTGESIRDIIEIYDPKGIGMGTEDIVHALYQFNITYIRYATLQPVWYRCYIASLPSLNIPNRMHSVIVDLRNPDNPMVLDPNFQRTGVKSYTYELAEGNWGDLIEVVFSDKDGNMEIMMPCNKKDCHEKD